VVQERRGLVLVCKCEQDRTCVRSCCAAMCCLLGRGWLCWGDGVVSLRCRCSGGGCVLERAEG
jgi:hypothetical protein